ncbi:MAG: hypothetical protein DHS20C18_28200 [Saprospiraceae bacterium]|nr:MAG: hypothetical protein DHS20C18_28200 [Saprospiraceae bacterium]
MFQRSISVALIVLALSISALAQPALYWINIQTGIERSTLLGGNREIVIPASQVTPKGIALDLWNQKIYWTDWVSDKIQRSNLDGTEIEDIIVADLALPDGLALDLEGEMMYWTDSGKKDIKRAKMDGTEMEVLVTYQNINLDGIALDPGANKMYWTEWGDGAAIGKVKRANLDGSMIEDIVAISGSIIKGIALDLNQGKVYWTDCTLGKVSRTNLNGGIIEDLVTGLSTPLGLALDLENGNIYWTDLGSRKLQRSSMDGSQVEDVITENINKPHGLAIDPDLPIQVGTKVVEDGLSINIFPNPVADFLHIEQLPAKSRIIIYTSQGREILNTFVEPSGLEVMVTHWPVGVYSLKVVNKNNQSTTYQFVKI